MIGAIAGDVIGSAWEFHRTKHYNFEMFTIESKVTDDSVLTVAVADCILHDKPYAQTYKEWGRKYPYAGWGGKFYQWLFSQDDKPYGSFGNGSAMRVSPVGFAFSTLEDVLSEAERSAAVTHNHPEGIKGACSTAAAIFLARQGSSKEEIRQFITDRYGYDLKHTIDELRPHVRFDETCQVSVPQAIIAFLDSDSYEDAVRKAVSLGGDADTQACIAGGIAQAFYRKIPAGIVEETRKRMGADMLRVTDEFITKYKTPF